jgi:hypothetical protein
MLQTRRVKLATFWIQLQDTVEPAISCLGTPSAGSSQRPEYTQTPVLLQDDKAMPPARFGKLFKLVCNPRMLLTPLLLLVLLLLLRVRSCAWCRTWLGCLPDRLSADKALSAVAVLEPGDTEKLAAAVPTPASSLPGSIPAAAAAGAAAGGPAATVSSTVGGGPAGAAAGQAFGGVSTAAGELWEPPRLAAAEVLVGRLVVCWEMITGAAAAGVLPHGWVPLEPLDVAANLTPGMSDVLRCALFDSTVQCTPTNIWGSLCVSLFPDCDALSSGASQHAAVHVQLDPSRPAYPPPPCSTLRCSPPHAYQSLICGKDAMLRVQ